MPSIKRKPLHRALFNTADYYSKGGALLGDNVVAGRKDASLAAPALLCNSFCIELLLKCLRIVELDDVFTIEQLETRGIKLDGHKYSVLYDKLDSSVQARVAKTYSELFKERRTAAEYRELLKQLGDNSFVEWRYIYEATEDKWLDVSLQLRVIDSLGRTAERYLRSKA